MEASKEVSQSRLHATVLGHVQGVGFRYFVAEQARLLRLNGWVRNLPAGTVEVLAEGSKPNLDVLLTCLSKGPAGARVSNVHYDWSEPTGEFDSFRVTYF